MAWIERYIRSDAAGGGNGTTNTNSGANGAWTLAEAIAAYTAGMLLWIRAGIYANTTNSRLFSTSGSATAPVWLRGFKTTPGDMDAVNADHGTFASGTEIPAITFTTGTLTLGAGQFTVSNVDVDGAPTGAVLNVTAGHVRCYRVSARNTNAGGGAYALSAGNSNNTFTRGYFNATSSANAVVNVPSSGQCLLAYCYVSGGSASGDGVVVATALTTYRTVFAVAGNGIRAATGTSIFHSFGDDFNACGGSPIKLDVIPSHSWHFDNVMAAWTAGFGIHNNSGTNSNQVVRNHNVFYDSLGSGSNIESGWGDSPAFGAITESANPFNNPGSGDYSLKSTGNAYGATFAYPRPIATTTYADRGAVQHLDTGGGGTIPAASDVRSGVAVGGGTGTLVVPAASVVLAGNTFDNGTNGTATVPTASQVLAGIAYGAGGNALTGNVVLPSVGDVQQSVTFGPSSGLTGTFVVPTQAQVENGVGYGAGGTEFTGTLVASGMTLSQLQAELNTRNVTAVVMARLNANVGDTLTATAFNAAYVAPNNGGIGTLLAGVTLADNAITAAKIASGALTSAKFAVGSLTGPAVGVLEWVALLWRRFFKGFKKSGSTASGQLIMLADDGTTPFLTQPYTDDGAGNQTVGAAS